MKYYFRFLSLVLGLLAATYTYSETLEEIVVSASKVEQDSAHVSLSQDSLSSEWISDLYIDTFEELSFFVPGLFIQEQSINSAGYAIRGMTSDNPEASRSPRVSVWYYGMDISRSQGAYVSMYDIDKVDVYKGPNSALFGTGGQIGGVNIQNRLAETLDSDEINILVGNFNEFKLSGFANYHLHENNAVRFSLLSHTRDGYISTSDGNELGGIDTQAFRFSIRLGSFNHFIDSQISYEKNDPSSIAFQTFLPETQVPDKPSDPFTDANLGNTDDLVIDREIVDFFLRYSALIDDQSRIETSVLLRDVYSADTFDPDGMSIDLVTAFEVADYQTYQLQSVFKYTHHNFTADLGISFFKEDVDVTFAANINEQFAVKLPVIQSLPDLALIAGLVDNDLYLADGTPNPFVVLPLSTQRYEEQTESVENTISSIFGDFTIALHRLVELGIGFRYSHESLETTVNTPGFQLGGQPSSTETLGNLFLTPENPSKRESSANKNASGITGHISLIYYIEPYGNLYMTYARGRRPDILNYTEASTLEELAEETVDSYEFGFSFDLNDSFSLLSGALYYYDFNNFATQRSGVDALAFIADDNANASIKGIELSYTQLFTDQWLLFSNITYNDAVFDESEIIQGENRFRYAPEWTGSLSLSKDIPLKDSWSLRLTTQAKYQSEVFFEDDNATNNGNNRQGGFSTYNFYLDALMKERLTLNAYVLNLTDKKYIIDAGNFGQLFGLPTYVPAIGRQFGVSFQYKFTVGYL